MPVCYCIVILTIAMIRKMVIVMINMMVITYRPLVGLEAPSKQYACCRDGGGRRTRLLYGLTTIKHCTDSIDHTMLDEILSQNVEYIARTKHKI